MVTDSNFEDLFHLKPIWGAILEVYGEFEKICRKEGFRFFAGGGTGIGAVRHGGFIPWDDDLDVVMPIEDYERFRAIADKVLPPHLRLVTWHNTLGYDLPFGKIVDTRMDKLVALRKATGLPIRQGIFVDVFLLSGVPNSLLARGMLVIKVWMAQLAYLYCSGKTKGLTLRHHIAHVTGYLASLVFGRVDSLRAYMALREKISGSLPYDGSSRCGVYYGRMGYVYHFIVPSHCYAASVKVPFCDCQMRLAIGFDEILRAEYGDYLQLPPKDKMRPHHGNQAQALWFENFPRRG